MQTPRMRTSGVASGGAGGSASRAAAPAGRATTAWPAASSSGPPGPSTRAPAIRPPGSRSATRRVASRRSAPAAAAAAAIASISWPMPWAGKTKPSGAAWSSSSRRARSPGIRSSGTPSIFSRYPRMTRLTNAPPKRAASSPRAEPSGGPGGSGGSGRWSR